MSNPELAAKTELPPEPELALKDFSAKDSSSAEVADVPISSEAPDGGLAAWLVVLGVSRCDVGSYRVDPAHIFPTAGSLSIMLYVRIYSFLGCMYKAMTFYLRILMYTQTFQAYYETVLLVDKTSSQMSVQSSPKSIINTELFAALGSGHCNSHYSFSLYVFFAGLCKRA